MGRYVDDPDGGGGNKLMWWRILELWPLVELDLHQTFGLDLGDKDLLRARPWPWLRRRILGLVWEPGTRLQRSLRPEDTPRSMLPYPPEKKKRVQ